MSFRFQLRRGTTAERNASNPVLAAGEPAVVLDSGQPAELVLGDGVTAMADLRAAVWDDDARLAAAATATQPGGLGTAAAADVADLATAAQGAKADTAVQPGDLVGPQGLARYGLDSAADLTTVLTAAMAAGTHILIPYRATPWPMLTQFTYAGAERLTIEFEPGARVSCNMATGLAMDLTNTTLRNASFTSPFAGPITRRT